MDKRLKKLEEEQRRLMKEIEKGNYSKQSGNSGSLLQFVIGLILLGAGLFWIFQSVDVRTSYASFYLGRWHIPNGTIIIPLLIGILMLFLMERKIYGWIVTGIGIAVILIAVITSVNLVFSGGNLFNYILMFGFTVVGGGLVLKNLFKK